jgi:hypothetical protein
MSERLSQKVALVACLDPDSIDPSATFTGDVIDASRYNSLMFVLSCGVITSSGKITLTVYKGTVATAASITSSVASVTLGVTTGASDQDKQAIIDVDVSKETSYRYYKGTVVANGETTTSGSFYSMHVFADSSRFHPASDNDLASVKSITLA